MKELINTLKSMLMVVLIFSTTIAYAQRAETPDYQYDLGGKIDYMTLTDACFVNSSWRWFSR